MNIKNVIKNTALVAACAMALSTQCMLVQKAKAVLNGVSTALAITMANTIAGRATYNAYLINKDPVKHIEKSSQCETRPATADEEQFLRPYVGKDVQLRVIPDYESNDFSPLTNGKVVAMTDRLPGMAASMTEIIELGKREQWVGTEDGLNFADAYIAAGQHEAGHVKNNDLAKRSITDIALSTSTTAAGVKLFKKIYPKDATAGLLKTAKRSLTKCLGGYALQLATTKLSSELWKFREDKADDNIEESKRRGMILLLDAAEFRENNPVKPEYKIEMSLKDKINFWLLNDHPSHEQRKQRLLRPTKKA